MNSSLILYFQNFDVYCFEIEVYLTICSFYFQLQKAYSGGRGTENLFVISSFRMRTPFKAVLVNDYRLKN